MSQDLRNRIAKRLKRAMDEHPQIKSQPALQKKSGIGQATIGRILRAEVNVGVETLDAIAKVFGKDATFLIVDEANSAYTPMKNEPLGISETIGLYAVPARALARVPVISWVKAGEWSEVEDTFEPGDADDWAITSANVGRNAFALRVVGDSMTSPYGLSIPEGAVIIVEPDAEPINGSIVVAKLTDTQEATVKRLVIDGPNKYLKPLNPAYAPIPINGNCRIVGVAKKIEMDL